MTWQKKETAPKDGSVFYIATLVKWTPYKTGKGGRWQEHTGYGWRNLEVDEFVWQPKVGEESSSHEEKV